MGKLSSKESDNCLGFELSFKLLCFSFDSKDFVVFKVGQENCKNCN